MLAALLLATASTLAGTPLAASPLAGTWTVDLTAKPGDPPYTKAMTLVLNPDGSVSGSFYDSAIEASRWKTAGNRTSVSFRTTDGNGSYHTAACLEGDIVRGQTWAEHRSFLFNWNATRTKPTG